MSSLVLNKSSSNFLIISVNTCNITVPKLDAKCIHSSKHLSYAWKVGDFKLDDKLLQYLQRSLLLLNRDNKHVCHFYEQSSYSWKDLFVKHSLFRYLYFGYHQCNYSKIGIPVGFFKQCALSFHHSYKKSYATINN